MQMSYQCVTCGLVNGMVCCEACVKVCHGGHDVRPNRFGDSYCDCGERGRCCLTAATKVSNLAVGMRVRVAPTVDRPRYDWGSVDHSSVGTIARIESAERVVVSFPEQPTWVAPALELMVVSGSTAAASTTSVAGLSVGDHVRVRASVSTPR
jgi:hypothetical protein